MTLTLLAATLVALVPTVVLWMWWHEPTLTTSESIRKVLSEPDARIHL